MTKLTGWRRRGALRSARPSSQSLAPGTSCRSLQVAFKTNHSVNCSHEISMESVIHLLPRTKDPSCLFEPKIALFGFGRGLPMLSIRYWSKYSYILYYQVMCKIWSFIEQSQSKARSTVGYIATKKFRTKFGTKKFRKGRFTSLGCFSMNFCVPWVWRTMEL